MSELEFSRGAPTPVEPPRQPRPRAVEAQYPGHCPNCGEGIRQGDLIVSDGDRQDGIWVHQECRTQTPLVQPTCPRCGLQHRGAC